MDPVLGTFLVYSLECKVDVVIYRVVRVQGRVIGNPKQQHQSIVQFTSVMKLVSVLSLAAAAAQAKVSVEVHRALETKGLSDVTVLFHSINLDALPRSTTDRRTQVFEALSERSTVALAETASILDSSDCQNFWIAPVAVCNGLTSAQIELLSKLPGVKSIHGPIEISLTQPLEKEAAPKVGLPPNAPPQWGVETIGAPSIWKYFKGKGVVIGSIDTGAEYRHESIKHNWRSYKGWFNPYNGTAIELPIDSQTHGTHTIGTMVGSHGIGVAPDAQWIACLGLYGASGTSAALLSCAQFMLCPSRLDGTRPECKLGADVINNSWGSTGAYNPWYEDVVAAWRAAGITPVFANGNAGPKCASTGTPGAYNRVISVGAIGSPTDDPNQLAVFSSKGPANIRDANNNTVTIIKPDVAAPGFFTLSSNALNLTDYSFKAGTSMAAPHVAGVVALLRSAQPDLTYDEIYAYITKTTDRDVLKPEPELWYFANGTVRAPGSPNCGNVSDASWPNNRYGYGRINVGTILRDGKLNDTPTKKPTT
ncbi:hypothetical protein B5M09_008926, partial [Aphanomyces astaci]